MTVPRNVALTSARLRAAPVDWFKFLTDFQSSSQ